MIVERATTVRHRFDIKRLQREVLPSDRPCDPNEGVWWVAYDDNYPVAFAGLRPSAQWLACGYLCRAGVVETHRGRGLQRRLIQLRERHARRSGMEWIITDTYKNPASSNSLIACGFRLFEPSVPWGVSQTLYWRKKIN